MNKLQRDLVEVLTHGEYVQGDNELRSSDNKYCCWGVAADLVCKRDKLSWREEPDGAWMAPEAIGTRMWLTDMFATRELGITYDVQRIVGGLNDNSLPFPVIARVLRKLFNNVVPMTRSGVATALLECYGIDRSQVRVEDRNA